MQRVVCWLFWAQLMPVTRLSSAAVGITTLTTVTMPSKKCSRHSKPRRAPNAGRVAEVTRKGVIPERAAAIQEAPVTPEAPVTLGAAVIPAVAIREGAVIPEPEAIPVAAVWAAAA